MLFSCFCVNFIARVRIPPFYQKHLYRLHQKNVRRGIFFFIYPPPVEIFMIKKKPGIKNGNTSQLFRNTLATVFETIAEPAFILHRDGSILCVNKAFTLLYGKNAEECSQASIYDITPRELAGSRKKKFDEAFRSGKTIFFEDIQNGSFYRHVLNPVLQNDGTISTLYVRSQDITEFKLKENEAKNRKIFNDALIEAIPGAFYMLDAQGRYVQWNAYQQNVIVGRDDEEMKKFPAIETIHPDDRQMVLERMENIMQNGVEDSDEVRTLVKGGSEWRWFRISGKRIVIDGNPLLIGIGIDINERKLAEETALKNSEDRFRTLFEEHSAVKLVIEPDSGNIIDANKAAVKFYGWPAEVLRTMRIQEINTLQAEKVQKQLQPNRNSELDKFSARHRRADGSIRDVDVFATNVSIAGKDLIYSIVHDVTESKLAENQLRKLSTAIGQSPVTVFITDLSGNIEYVNPAFTRHTGYSREEAIGNNECIMHPGLMQKEVNSEIWESILAGKVWQGELCNRKKNGELYWEDAVISPIINEEGMVTNFVAIKEEITEKKKLWTDLVQAKEKAEESDRLKSAFLANISHEIRTPMNGILGFAELLKEPELTGDEQSEYIDLIRQSGERMLSLINDLIDISRIEAGETFFQITETPVNTLLHNLHAFFRPQAEKKALHLSCSTGLSDSKSTIDTDETKLGQILTNLIQNALKFTHKGNIAFGYERVGENLEFFVSDTGIGIPAAMKEKIFDRFRQLDNSLTRTHEGSGLGLCITKAYVEKLGGKIDVESHEGQDCTFRFTIPYSPCSSQTHPASLKTLEERARLTPPRALTIVVAEDDETSRLLLQTTLKDDNIALLTACNGIEAVDLVRKNPGIDLVLMDIRMPEMNGFDAAKAIKTIRPLLPVIAQTAFASAEERNKALEAGCDGFLSKPVKKNELLEMIIRVLDRQFRRE